MAGTNWATTDAYMKRRRTPRYQGLGVLLLLLVIACKYVGCAHEVADRRSLRFEASGEPMKPGDGTGDGLGPALPNKKGKDNPGRKDKTISGTAATMAIATTTTGMIGPITSPGWRCPAGQYFSTNNCTACTSGTFSSQPGALACTKCPSGTYSGFGATSCTPCQAGTYSGGGAPSCLQCSAGTYQNLTRQASCLSCPIGTFGAGVGSKTCTACLAGTFSAAEGAKSCLTCPGGTFSGTGMSNCTSCQAGTYSGAAGSPTCQPCPAGTTSLAGAANCSVCAAGTLSSAGSPTCQPCPAGTTSLAGAAICSACAAGTFSGAGSATCQPCPAGTTSLASAASCSVCPSGTFSAAGSATCKPCPSRTTSLAGAASCSVCSAGTFDSAGSPTCKPCNTTADCKYGQLCCNDPQKAAKLCVAAVAGSCPDWCSDGGSWCTATTRCCDTTIGSACMAPLADASCPQAEGSSCTDSTQCGPGLLCCLAGDGAYKCTIDNAQCVEPPMPESAVTDRGYADRPRGFYDVMCRGAAHDYCRYVGSQAWWSCALAGGVQQYSPKGQFSEALSSPVPCSPRKGRRMPGWAITDKGYSTYSGGVLQGGWYDISCQGATNDYCRYVGDGWWSCALAEGTSQYTPPGMFEEANSSPVPCSDVTGCDKLGPLQCQCTACNLVECKPCNATNFKAPVTNGTFSCSSTQDQVFFGDFQASVRQGAGTSYYVQCQAAGGEVKYQQIAPSGPVLSRTNASCSNPSQTSSVMILVSSNGFQCYRQALHQLCQPGLFRDFDNQCTPCPVGSFSVDGVTCSSCPPNTYAAAPGATSCLQCSKGMISESGASSCTWDDSLSFIEDPACSTGFDAEAVVGSLSWSRYFGCLQQNCRKDLTSLFSSSTGSDYNHRKKAAIVACRPNSVGQLDWELFWLSGLVSPTNANALLMPNTPGTIPLNYTVLGATSYTGLWGSGLNTKGLGTTAKAQLRTNYTARVSTMASGPFITTAAAYLSRATTSEIQLFHKLMKSLVYNRERGNIGDLDRGHTIIWLYVYFAAKKLGSVVRLAEISPGIVSTSSVNPPTYYADTQQTFLTMPHTMGAVCGDGVDANGKVVVVAPFLYGAKFCESTINDNMNSVRLKTYFEIVSSSSEAAGMLEASADLETGFFGATLSAGGRVLQEYSKNINAVHTWHYITAWQDTTNVKIPWVVAPDDVPEPELDADAAKILGTPNTGQQDFEDKYGKYFIWGAQYGGYASLVYEMQSSELTAKSDISTALRAAGVTTTVGAKAAVTSMIQNGSVTAKAYMDATWPYGSGPECNTQDIESLQACLSTWTTLKHYVIRSFYLYAYANLKDYQNILNSSPEPPPTYQETCLKAAGRLWVRCAALSESISMYGVELGMDQFWRKATADVEALQRSIDTLLKRIVSNTTSECATEVTAVEAYTNKNETTYNWIPEGSKCGMCQQPAQSPTGSCHASTCDSPLSCTFSCDTVSIPDGQRNCTRVSFVYSVTAQTDGSATGACTIGNGQPACVRFGTAKPVYGLYCVDAAGRQAVCPSFTKCTIKEWCDQDPIPGCDKDVCAGNCRPKLDRGTTCPDECQVRERLKDANKDKSYCKQCDVPVCYFKDDPNLGHCW